MNGWMLVGLIFWVVVLVVSDRQTCKPRRDARGRFVTRRRPYYRAPSLTLLLVWLLGRGVRLIVVGLVRLLSAAGRSAYWTVAELWWGWQAWCEAPQRRDDELRKRADAEHRCELVRARLTELHTTTPTPDPTKEEIEA